MIGEMETGIREISRYGNITLCAAPAAMREAGFEPADILLVKIGAHEMEMPVGLCYHDADSGEPVCCLLEDPDGGEGWVVLAVNAGNLAAEMELAEIVDTEEAPGYRICWTEGTGYGSPVSLRMVKKQGYLEEYRMHRNGAVRTNRREDYAALSDEEYANFREIRTAGMGRGRLYRSSSPVNPALNRNREADAALKKAGIRTVMNMTDSEDRMKRYKGFEGTACAECAIIPLNMGMDFFSDDFRGKLADGFRYFTVQDGPFLLHCNEGKDRAGFAAAVLECLMGAGREEIVKDYMLSFSNYYGLEPGSEEYELTAAANIEASLARAFGTGLRSFGENCLAACAERYLKESGLEEHEIQALKAKLGEPAPKADPEKEKDGAPMIDEIRKELFQLRDEKYRDFQISLIPTVRPETVIGVRTPALRDLAKRIAKQEDVQEFLQDLPHRYFEENQLHAFILSGSRDFEACIQEVCRFLPFVDNWATCDQMSPKIFKKHRTELMGYIRRWLSSGDTYTVRFAIGMLMEHFLEQDFDSSCPEMVSAIRTEEYYINMMTAWYFATALAKQYDSVLPYLEQNRLDPWTHNKAIQKAVESRRISEEQKTYLRSLKRKNKKG